MSQKEWDAYYKEYKNTKKLSKGEIKISTMKTEIDALSVPTGSTSSSSKRRGFSSSRASVVAGSASADAAGGVSSKAPVLCNLNQGDMIPYTIQVGGSYLKFATETNPYVGKSKRTTAFLQAVRKS